MRGMLAVCRKELRQIARDQRTLMILVFIPAFFLLLYGYALNFDIRNVALAVEDLLVVEPECPELAGTEESSQLRVVHVGVDHFAVLRPEPLQQSLVPAQERRRVDAAGVPQQGHESAGAEDAAELGPGT